MSVSGQTAPERKSHRRTVTGQRRVIVTFSTVLPTDGRAGVLDPPGTCGIITTCCDSVSSEKPMSSKLRCPEGHEWEPEPGEAAAGASPVCPICNDPHRTLTRAGESTPLVGQPPSTSHPGV